MVKVRNYNLVICGGIMVLNSKIEQFNSQEKIDIEQSINSFVFKKISDICLIENLDNERNIYKYYNELIEYNYPIIYKVDNKKKVQSIFNKLMNANLSFEEKVYIYMNSYFRAYIPIEDFLKELFVQNESNNIFELFNFYKFYGKVSNIAKEYIEIEPLYVFSKNKIRIVKALEPDDAWKGIKVNDEVTFAFKKICESVVYGKTIKLKEFFEIGDLSDWEAYSRSLLKISIEGQMSDINRSQLTMMKQLDFRKTRKIAKNQELITECLKNFKSCSECVEFIRILGDKNSFKYDEVRSKLCYKPNNKLKEGRLIEFFDRIIEEKCDLEDKVYLYMNTSLKTTIPMDVFIKKIRNQGFSSLDVKSAFDDYKFYGKVTYSTGNIVKIKPLTMNCNNIIMMDKKYQSILKKDNVRIGDIVLYKLKKYLLEDDEFDVQVTGYIKRN